MNRILRVRWIQIQPWNSDPVEKWLSSLNFFTVNLQADFERPTTTVSVDQIDLGFAALWRSLIVSPHQMNST
jgi:hypothetical protein